MEAALQEEEGNPLDEEVEAALQEEDENPLDDIRPFGARVK